MVRLIIPLYLLVIILSGCARVIFKEKLTSSFPFTVILQSSYSTIVDSPITLVPQIIGLNNRTVTSYTWDFNDGTDIQVTNNSSLSHAFSHTGIYNISVIVKLSDNATNTATSSVTVEDPLNDELNKPLLTQAHFATNLHNRLSRVIYIPHSYRNLVYCL